MENLVDVDRLIELLLFREFGGVLIEEKSFVDKEADRDAGDRRNSKGF